jgi:hypothetical protein
MFQVLSAIDVVAFLLRSGLVRAAFDVSARPRQPIPHLSWVDIAIASKASFKAC